MYVILHAFFFVEWILRKILWKKGRLLKKVLKKSLIPIPRRQQVRIFNSVNYFPFVIFRSYLVFHLHHGYHAQITRDHRLLIITVWRELIMFYQPTILSNGRSRRIAIAHRNVCFSAANKPVIAKSTVMQRTCSICSVEKRRTVFLPLLFFSLFSFFFFFFNGARETEIARRFDWPVTENRYFKLL